MSSWAKPGVKCVCILAKWGARHVPEVRHPVVGDVLTIQEVDFFDGRVGLTFEGLGEDDFYAACCFRPLVTRSQEHDVALFKHLLETQGADA